MTGRQQISPYNKIITVKMQLSHCRPRSKPKKSRLRTLCTIDTYDANFAESFYRKGKENDQRYRNCPYSASLTKSNTNKKESKQHERSQFSAYNCSRVKEGSNNKGKRAMSISRSSVNRVRTDYSEFELNGTRGIGASLKKKLVFASQQTYKFDCWQVNRSIIDEGEWEVMQGYQQPNKKQKWVMIKTKSKALKQQYQKQLKAYAQIFKLVKNKDKNPFLKVRMVLKDKKQWLIITDNFYHANWTNDQFYMLLSRLKNSHSQMQFVVREMTKTIDFLSKNGYAHGAISIQNIYFPISKGELQLTDSIRIAGLRHSFRVDSKEAFLSMTNTFKTPPQVLNFISFQCRQEFERDYLQVIGRVKEGWQIDVWSLGVLILEILNGGSLSGEGSERPQMITLQKQLPIRYSYLLTGLQVKLKSLLLQMLNPDPLKRPHPRQILRLL